MYYEREWDLICYMFDTMAEDMDTPIYIIEGAFNFIKEEYDNDPTIPPSILMIDAKDKALRYREQSKTDFAISFFDSCLNVIEHTLYAYLQDIFLIEDEDREDYMAERVSMWGKYFTPEEYEEIKAMYS